MYKLTIKERRIVTTTLLVELDPDLDPSEAFHDLSQCDLNTLMDLYDEDDPTNGTGIRVRIADEILSPPEDSSFSWEKA